MILLHGGASAQSGDARTVITGGPDATGQGYTWTVANQYDSPLVAVEIPHFRGGIFTAPTGWNTECTNRVGIGVPDEPGLCKAEVESIRYAVTKPQTASFQLQLAAKGAEQGLGDVRVRFADGTEHVVSQVILPVRESLAEKFSPMLGLAVIGAMVVLLGGRRKRREARAESP